ncbi:hypothetical protein [Paenibacillus sp. FSL R7-0026]|uniref:hypothetical protein n=1 Tax=Paenibacillus sp. FSL R7-0026 TaxID=2921668 RepID=UPI0030F6702E
MPKIDSFTLDNYSIDGPSSGVETTVTTPFYNNNPATFSNGANGVGWTMANFPAGTRNISLIPTSVSAKMTVSFASGPSGTQFLLGLQDSNGVIWPLHSMPAYASYPNVSFISVSIKTDEVAYATYCLTSTNVSGTMSWQVSTFSKPPSFDPNAGQMNLVFYVFGNTSTASGSLYMSSFKVTSA